MSEEELRWEEVVGELSEEELEELVGELSERFKDIVFMKLEPTLRKKVQEVIKGNPYINDYVVITWKMVFVINDLVQIIGRIRRKGFT